MAYNILTTKEAAALLGVSESAMKEYAKRGIFPNTFKLPGGGGYRFFRMEIETYIARSERMIARRAMRGV